MDFELLRKHWPTAHPNWRIILRKKNGQEKITKKKNDEKPLYFTEGIISAFDIKRDNQTVQSTGKVYQVY